MVNDSDWSGIYVWQEVDGVYRYLGDLVFDEQEDGSVIWDAHLSDPDFSLTPETVFAKKAANFLRKQEEIRRALEGIGGSNLSFHVRMLSGVYKNRD